jgi:hypothetical protein
MTGKGNPIGLLRVVLNEFVTANLTALSRLISSNNLPVNKGNSPSEQRSFPKGLPLGLLSNYVPKSGQLVYR